MLGLLFHDEYVDVGIKLANQIQGYCELYELPYKNRTQQTAFRVIYRILFLAQMVWGCVTPTQHVTSHSIM